MARAINYERYSTSHSPSRAEWEVQFSEDVFIGIAHSGSSVPYKELFVTVSLSSPLL